MLKTLKALSVLLSYPTEELQNSVGDIGAALRQEALLPPEAVTELVFLLTELAGDDLYDVQERYVGLFDRSRSLSLSLFEHVHGESRDRGGAMVDLVETYRAAGYEPVSTDLPDHLPVLLEFLATRPLPEAQEILADAAHILEALRQRLVRRESAYAAVFSALVHLSGQAGDDQAVSALLQQSEDDPDDLAALDAVWEETQVTFGPDPNAGCPQVRDILSNMATPVTPAPGTSAAATK